MKIGIIGTREPDEGQCQLAGSMASYLTLQGHTVKTGGAAGVDERVMRNARPEHLEVYLPWSTYNLELIPPGIKAVHVYNRKTHPHWHASVGQFHPSPHRLIPTTVSLHARNFGIIEEDDMVLALPNKGCTGGTMQGVRIARALWIPVILVPTGQASASQRQSIKQEVIDLLQMIALKRTTSEAAVEAGIRAI